MHSPDRRGLNTITCMSENKIIIWDWNGTLLDDARICLYTINRMLRKRQLSELTMAAYREVFTFPVIRYYEAIGFDFTRESWDQAAMEFIRDYLDALPVCSLASGAKETLERFRAKGYRQAIVSAMEHDALLKSVNDLNISEYFDFIGGTGNHYGSGKTENAQNYLYKSGVNPSDITLIGDTLHDAEVARELNCHCILVAAGHQSSERLLQTGFPVIRSLNELELYI
jgi:phosphoglycolate phosphatase